MKEEVEGKTEEAAKGAEYVARAGKVGELKALQENKTIQEVFAWELRTRGWLPLRLALISRAFWPPRWTGDGGGEEGQRPSRRRRRLQCRRREGFEGEQEGGERAR